MGKEAGGEVDDRGNDALLLKDALEASILSERHSKCGECASVGGFGYCEPAFHKKKIGCRSGEIECRKKKKAPRGGMPSLEEQDGWGCNWNVRIISLQHGQVTDIQRFPSKK